VRYWKEKVTGVQLLAESPFHKNDNRNVEQKNHTPGASVFWGGAAGDAEQIEAGNRLYEQMWLYYNLFHR